MCITIQDHDIQIKLVYELISDQPTNTLFPKNVNFSILGNRNMLNKIFEFEYVSDM